MLHLVYCNYTSKSGVQVFDNVIKNVVVGIKVPYNCKNFGV